MIRILARVVACSIASLAIGLAIGAEPQKPMGAVVNTAAACEQCKNPAACQDKCKKGVDICQYGCSATDAACKDPCAREYDRCTKWCSDGKCTGCPDAKGK